MPTARPDARSLPVVRGRMQAMRAGLPQALGCNRLKVQRPASCGRPSDGCPEVVPVCYLTCHPADRTIASWPARGQRWLPVRTRRRTHMGRIWAVRIFAIAGVLALAFTTASADEGTTSFSTSMTGFQETPPILSNGSGTFHATVNGDSLTYTESFAGLTSNVTQSHIHFAERSVAGSFFVFLCTNLGDGPAGTPACPAAGGTVTGTVTAANVLGVPGQNISAG